MAKEATVVSEKQLIEIIKKLVGDGEPFEIVTRDGKHKFESFTKSILESLSSDKDIDSEAIKKLQSVAEKALASSRKVVKATKNIQGLQMFKWRIISFKSMCYSCWVCNHL